VGPIVRQIFWLAQVVDIGDLGASYSKMVVANRVANILSFYPPEAALDNDNPRTWANKYVLKNLLTDQDRVSLLIYTLSEEPDQNVFGQESGDDLNKARLRRFILGYYIEKSKWETLDHDFHKELWFAAVKGGDLNIVKNIIDLYQDRPINSDHPLWWKDASGNTAIFATLSFRNINRGVVKLLLDSGSYPRSKTADLSIHGSEAPKNNTKKMIAHYALKRNVSKILATKTDEKDSDAQLANKIQVGLNYILQDCLDDAATASDKEALRKDILQSAYNSYEKIISYSFDGDAFDVKKFAEVWRDEIVGDDGNIHNCAYNDALTTEERRVLAVIISGGGCIKFPDTSQGDASAPSLDEDLALPDVIRAVMSRDIESMKRVIDLAQVADGSLESSSLVKMDWESSIPPDFVVAKSGASALEPDSVVAKRGASALDQSANEQRLG